MDDFDNLPRAVKTLAYTGLAIYLLIPSCMLCNGFISLCYTGLDPHNFMQLSVVAGWVAHIYMLEPGDPRQEPPVDEMNVIWRMVHIVGWYTQRRMRRAAPLLKGA